MDEKLWLYWTDRALPCKECGESTRARNYKSETPFCVSCRDAVMAGRVEVSQTHQETNGEN